MKVITSVTHTQSILAPKGYIFDLDKVNGSNLFSIEEMIEDHRPRLGLGGRLLEWEEPWNISGEIVDETFWDQHLVPCLVRVQN